MPIQIYCTEIKDTVRLAIGVPLSVITFRAERFLIYIQQVEELLIFKQAWT